MDSGSDEFNDERTVVGERATLDRPETRTRAAYLTVVAGPNVGEMYRVGNGGEIGRSLDATFRTTDTEMSRRHARFVARDGVFVVEDLNSTNGTFVNGKRVQLATLNDGDKVQVGTQTILRFSFQDSLDEQFQRKLLDSAIRDGLTKAFNKQHLRERLDAELAFARRHAVPLALLLLDLDHFKRVNDTHGHLAGDAVLVTFAGLVHGLVRRDDIFARYGGEEFAVLCRATDKEAALGLAEAIRAGVEATRFEHAGTHIPVTVSVGLASLPEVYAEDSDDLVASADAALYAAKSAGRNRVNAAR